MTTSKKPFKLEFSILFSCVKLWFYVYCFYVLLPEIITLSYYLGGILIMIIITSYVAVWYLALPQPASEFVNDVLGSDPKLMKFRKSSLEFTISSFNSYGDEEQILDDNNFFAVIGHRGAGLDAPENSLAAFKQCQEKGCRAVEFDLVLTADGVPVLFHDDTVDRITNSSGVVQQMTWDQLKELDISAKHPLQKRFAGERVALFSDVVKLCLAHDIHMIIDVKDDSPKLIQELVRTYKEFPQMYKRAMVSGFNPLIIYQLRARDPAIVCSLAWRPCFYSRTGYGSDSTNTRRYSSLPKHLAACVQDNVTTWAFNHFGYYLLGISAVLLHKDSITAEEISKWESRNIRVVAWTVNRPQEKMYLRRVLKIAYITDTLITEGNGHIF